MSKGEDWERPDESAVLRRFQQEEINGAALYAALSKRARNERNRSLISGIAEDEARHARIFKSYTNAHLFPNRLKTIYYTLLSKLFGFAFCIKLFERNENRLSDRYSKTALRIPEISQILEDERNHESLLVAMLDEEQVRYRGSVVLGMSDALVELTGSLAGYTLAMRDTRLIAAAVAITGLSAALSMAASGYLSMRAEKREDALTSSVSTGVAYWLTAALLILPYIFLQRQDYVPAFGLAFATAIGVIAIFNGYISIVLDRPFRRGFLEMSLLSLGISAVSFVMGIAIKRMIEL
ncbi:MAG: VIT1/CCC1 family protein [Synergistaceae bacterium]|jgi:VIT1/CCC1 family predicted Fe2+/Mn2+ transporter|nr:VIT1/CCC1 family protein [Synergistaceae bacterium]